MGQNPSALTQEDIDAMKVMSNCTFISFIINTLNFVLILRLVSEKELKRLHRRFKKLDKDSSGTLTIDEFMSIPELAGKYN
jgi:hypothetical protein